MKEKLLIVAAHPDDELFGCGGIVARLIQKGYEAYVIILEEGICSRYKTINTEKLKEKYHY